MHCPKCKSINIRVMESFTGLDNSVYRRRKCSDCGCLFRTAEIIPTNEAFTEAYKKAHKEKMRRVKR